MELSIRNLLDRTIYNETLELFGIRIDFAYHFYKDHESSEDKQERKAADEAFQFLIFAYNLPEECKEANAIIDGFMIKKAKHRDNLDYIPSKRPHHIKFDKSGRFHHDELLHVNDEARAGDILDNVKMMGRYERARYRVHIFRGQFFQNGKLFDTKRLIAHLKKGYAAITLNAHGEISIFSHKNGLDNLRHSSMNAGVQVVFAGEIKIEKGRLTGIVTYSGHYHPTVYDVWRFLEYANRMDVDISQVEVMTGGYMTPQFIKDPANPNRFFYLSNASSLFDPFIHVNQRAILKDQLYLKMNDILDKKIKKYTKNNPIDPEKELKNDLHKQRARIAADFQVAITDFHAQLKKRTMSYVEFIWEIKKLKKLISNFEAQNQALSLTHNKSKNNGSLADIFRLFKSEVKHKTFRALDVCTRSQKRTMKSRF